MFFFIKIPKILGIMLGIFIFMVLFTILVNVSINLSVQEYIYDVADELPPRDYAVVLGTAKYVNNDVTQGLNQYYWNRLLATKELLETQKIKIILLSGAKHNNDYDEPQAMRQDLLKMGVSPTIIKMDKRGLRTLDSIIRADSIFQINQMILVSQKFHCQRAIFIAKYYAIDAICFVAQDPDHSMWFILMREYLARVWMLLDLLRNRQAKYMYNEL